MAILAVSGVAVGIFVLMANKSARPATVAATTAPAIVADDWSRGTTQPKATIIEYGDFQCPACGQYEVIVQKLEKEYGDRVQFVFRNFPLPMHPNAMIAARAAEAAGLQGKYWEMHDLLYAKQQEWSETPTASVVKMNFDAYATSLGLALDKFHADMSSRAVQDRIDAQQAGGTAAKIDHTPTFFINLTQVANPTSYANFKSVIDAVIGSSTPSQ